MMYGSDTDLNVVAHASTSTVTQFRLKAIYTMEFVFDVNFRLNSYTCTNLIFSSKLLTESDPHILIFQSFSSLKVWKIVQFFIWQMKYMNTT